MHVVTQPAHDPAKNIQWDQMPNGPVVLGCLDSPAARMKIACAFTTLSSLSLGATVYTVAKFIVISGVSIAYGFAMLTLALFIATIVSCLLQPSEAEIDWDLRQEAKGLLSGDPNSRLGYQAMRSQFMTRIVSDEEANKLMFADAHTKTYSQFINKHGSYSIRILDDTNKQALKPSFIAHKNEYFAFDKTCYEDQIAQQIVELEESRSLGVTLLDVEKYSVSSYDVFYREIQRRWTEVSFANPKEIRQKGLFASICKNNEIHPFKIPAHELTQKALKETAHLSVCHMPQELFELGVLNADSRLPNGLTIRERLQNELSSCKKLQDFAGIGQNFLFKHHLLSEDDSKLQLLIEDFVMSPITRNLRQKVYQDCEEAIKELADERDANIAKAIAFPTRRIQELGARQQQIALQLEKVSKELSSELNKLNAIDNERAKRKIKKEAINKKKELAKEKFKEDLARAEGELKELEAQYKALDDESISLYQEYYNQNGVVNGLDRAKIKKERHIERITGKITKHEEKISEIKKKEYQIYAKNEEFLLNDRAAKLARLQATERKMIEEMTLEVIGVISPA